MKISLALLITLILTVCGTGQALAAIINNLRDQAIPRAADGTELAITTIEQAIKSACEHRGWAAKKVDDGIMEASITVRGRHFAVIDIRYDQDSYSISHKDSTGLEYKPEQKRRAAQIHRNYNKWILLLRSKIELYLKTELYPSAAAK